MSLLTQAIESNDYPFFLAALRAVPSARSAARGADYNSLVLALVHGRLAMAKHLVTLGCPLNRLQNSGACTPLHYALRMRSAYLVRLLLERGALVGVRDGLGQTPVHLAFLEMGVPSERKADKPWGLLDAMLQIHVGMVGRHTNVTDNGGLSFLHIACTRKRVEMVAGFLMAGADVNCQVELNSETLFAGYTPLHFAVESRRPEIAELLLRNGADLYARDADGSTAVHLACERTDTVMIELLLAYDNRWENPINRYGITHFAAACASTSTDVVSQFLLRNPYIDVDFRTTSIDFLAPEHYHYSGYRPLHFAVERNNVATIQLLLSRGADCCACDARGCSPTDLAASLGHNVAWMVLRKACEEEYLSASERFLGVTEYSDSEGSPEALSPVHNQKDEKCWVAMSLQAAVNDLNSVMHDGPIDLSCHNSDNRL